jgi:hypothetical protein
MKTLEGLALMALLMAASAPRSAAPAESQEEALDRVRLSADILARWSPHAEDGGAELRAVLAKLGPEALAAAAKAESPAEVDAAVFSRLGPLAFGDNNSDLVYFPLTPCRLVDTRLIPAGPSPLAAGTPRSFDAHDSNLAAQGGSAAGCGVPDPDPAALAVTITAVNPQGAGNLRAYGASASAVAPTASVLNYALPGSGLNLANTTILPLLQTSLSPFEFTIRADVSTVHVVVDVVGYFLSPLRTPLVCQTVSDSFPVHPNSSYGSHSPLCPAGTTLTGGGVVATSSSIRILRSNADATSHRWRCTAANEGSTAGYLTCEARCCSTPGR